jgi:hypothetical protein
VRQEDVVLRREDEEDVVLRREDEKREDEKASVPEPPVLSAEELFLELTGTDLTLCPCCRMGRMRPVGIIPPGPEPAVQDSS